MNNRDLFSLKNKTALLTGAYGYLGSEIAKGLVQAGATLIINGRDIHKLNLLAEHLRSMGGKIYEWAADVTHPESIHALMPLLEENNQLDILINNAYFGAAATVDSATKNQFNAAYDITVSSAFHLIQSCLPYMKRHTLDAECASIINICSMYGHVSPDPKIYGESGRNNPPFYGPAKAGLEQLTRYLACHLAQEGVRVNSISPGPFVPPKVEKTNPEFYKALISKMPMQRVGVPSEIIGAILFLASNASSYVTGSDLRVDGGWTAW